jgi:hypothetical protein
LSQALRRPGPTAAQLSFALAQGMIVAQQIDVDLQPQNLLSHKKHKN